MTVGTGRILLTRRSPTYWRVTFDLPPLNIFGPAAIPQLDEIVTALETDEEVRVVVFDSAVDGFFLTHYDFTAKLEDTTRFRRGRPVCRRFPTCWPGSAALRSYLSPQFGAARRASAASSRSRVICASPAGKGSPVAVGGRRGT